MGERSTIDYLINHIVLPPKLPQEDDNSNQNDLALCHFLQDVLMRYLDSIAPELKPAWEPLATMLHNLSFALRTPSLVAENIQTLLQNIWDGDIAILPIRAQNACVIVRQLADETIFEAFEVDPPNATVMGTTGRVVRTFPGPSLAIPTKSLPAQLQEELASFLAQMDVDILDSAVAFSKKAGVQVDEVRDTNDPHHITVLLMAILRGLPGSRERNVLRIIKRTRNDILWDRAYLPWRRSPLWLIVRVALQTTLQQSGDASEYKNFMLFLHADLLSVATLQELPSDLLFCMQRKIANRLRKLAEQTTISEDLLTHIRTTIETSKGVLDQRWRSVQRQQEWSHPWDPSSLDIQADCKLSLHASKPYLIQRLAEGPITEQPAPFHPAIPNRLFQRQNKVSDFKPSRLTTALKNDTLLTLIEIENFVAQELVSIPVANLAVGASELQQCIFAYLDAAESAYRGNPETSSIMLLTVFLMWMVLDKLAIHYIPLLAHYSPEVSQTLLEPLLLNKRLHLNRLLEFQTYIQQRHINAVYGSVFDDKVTSTSFGVLFFNSAPDLINLKVRVEAKAESETRQKCSELLKATQLYDSRMSMAEELDHECHLGSTSRAISTKKCRKCKLVAKAKRATILVYEWPLPDDTRKAKAVIFETRPPLHFHIWRSTTYRILVQVCRIGQLASVLAYGQLTSYAGLRHIVEETSRVSYASKLKSFSKSHYASIKVCQATEEKVCVKNALDWHIYDSEYSRWVTPETFAGCSIASYCNPELHDTSPYNPLSYALTSTSHPPNQPLAEATHHLVGIGPIQYHAFGILRSGPHLQWLNIARELRTQTLAFSDPEVQALVIQAAFQVGPVSVGEYEWHAPLGDVQFGLLLTKEVERCIPGISDNWRHACSLSTMIVLTTRIMSSNDDPILFTSCIRVLQMARDVAFRWVQALSSGRSEGEDIEASTTQQGQLGQALLACLATYDVDPLHFDHVVRPGADVQTLLQSLILLHDNPPVVREVTVRHMARIQRLTHSLLPHLHHVLVVDKACFDGAIHAVWSAYQPTHNWTVVSGSNTRWLTTKTPTNIPSTREMTLHLDILTGSLLIDGKPLGSLPHNILNHPTYLRLFGQSKVHVTPSIVPGMTFSTCKEISAIGGCRFHFRMSERRLIIQATRGDQLYELIPHELFNDDLPIIFIQSFHHWLLLPKNRHMTRFHASSIDFQPIGTPWRAAQENWQLVFTEHEAVMAGKGQYDGTKMVDICSLTWRMVSNQLHSIEKATNLLVTVDNQRILQVSLPRYKLAFMLKNNRLESVNFRGMIVDSNQSCGTFYGLHHRLVLKSESPADQYLVQRSVLIPFGSVTYNTKGDHMSVTVELEGLPSVSYFKYDVNYELQTIVGPPSLLGELYRVYLHALTSHILPDPLLGRTGIEESLHRLSSSRCRSFQELGDPEKRLLEALAGLVAHRAWYPSHLKVMQTVHWQSLSPMGHHWNFPFLVQPILEYHKQLSIFTMDPTKENKDPEMSQVTPHAQHLHIRSISQNYYLHPAEYRQFGVAEAQDQVYPSTSSVTNGHRSTIGPTTSIVLLVSNMAALVQSWPTRMNVTANLWGLLQELGHIENDGSIKTLSYSNRFLKPDLSALFIPFYNLCRLGDIKTVQAQLTVTLSAMAYAGTSSQILATFLAFAISPHFQLQPLPNWRSFTLNDGTHPTQSVVVGLIMRHARSQDQCPPDGLVQANGEGKKKFNARRSQLHSTLSHSRATDIAYTAIEFWSNALDIPVVEDPYFKDGYKNALTEYFASCRRNRHLEAFAKVVQALLCNLKAPPTPSRFTTPLSTQSNKVYTRRAKPLCMPTTLLQLLQRKDAPTDLLESQKLKPPNQLHSIQQFLSPKQQTHPRNPPLTTLVNELLHCDGALLRKYGQSLAISDSSQDGLQRDYPTETNTNITSIARELRSYLEECHRQSSIALGTITDALSPQDEVESILALVDCWPRTATGNLLHLLSKDALSALSQESLWINAIKAFAASLMRLQRAHRLLKHAAAGALDDLSMELRNEINDETIMYDEPPDWLLIQIQGNFSRRPLQKSVAREMIAPRDQDNTLLQLNMGEGKTSVIAPLVASSLANGSNLVRIVVLKPLAKSMFALLVRRLAGLANRRIFYLPICRDLQLTDEHAQQLHVLFRTCAEERGILVVQPEHILSFKLLGIDLAKGAKSWGGPAHTLLATEKWLSTHTRDILDESDEVLNVQYQLVYTTGRQLPFENHPDRWLTIQEALQWAKEAAANLFSSDPDGLQVENSGPLCFPMMRILNPQIGRELSRQVAQQCIDCSRLRLLPPHLRLQALGFISSTDLSKTNYLQLKAELPTAIWKYLLQFRGLIGLGILQFIFEQKRWRVNFGLDPSRTLLAVPYRAKDVPATRADFGHPDVAISLTCLSYYYGGLTTEQLEHCFQVLLKLDNAGPIYETWVAGYNEVPSSLRQIVGINLDDIDQRDNVLFPLFRKHQAVVDFYLSRVVFPKEAKQFPSKLATSSWDLAERKTNVTTGFSGTNDNQDLLPTTITQRDPLNQMGTNARVLGFLLRPENDQYRILHGERHLLSSSDFLRQVVAEQPPVRVLLDVGAQMLDLQSPEIAQKWLLLEPNVEAIVFFDDDDQLVVMRRDKSVEALDSTPYAQNLDLCAVYLDDAHTRGTDLKFPRNFRAAVTLGPNLTKDRLVQGCMRMRKLGHGHSVVFLAPPEVDKAIRSLSSLGPRLSRISTMDILRWTIHGTCDHIIRQLPQWAEQGVDFHKRREAWRRYTSRPSAPSAMIELRTAWESQDAQTLEQMYCQVPSNTANQHPAYTIPEMRTHLQKLGLELISGMEMDEEQEREVHYEVEKEREVQRPLQAQPAVHRLHNHVRHLVQSGTFVRQSSAFIPLFSGLSHLGTHEWSTNLLATAEFSATIIGSVVDSTDYLRPVHWILTVKGDSRLVVLSPFEANALLPLIRKSRFVHLHVYAPRVNESMEPMEDLRFFAIPPLPRDWKAPLATDMVQLNLWAGQLYLKDHATFTHLRMVLGLVGDETRWYNERWWQADGFVPPENRRGQMKEICKFQKSPIPFLKELISLRQRGIVFDKSHIGKILDGHLLTEKDFKYHQTASHFN